MKTMKILYLAVLVFLSGSAYAAAPFGGDEDVNYARNLWQTMLDAGYAGANGLMSRPYMGQHPHGAILDTIEGQIAVEGKLHTIIVKRNYGGEGVSIATVANDSRHRNAETSGIRSRNQGLVLGQVQAGWQP
jgi:hypothetical protein